jgi:hypothetical protein
VSRHRLPRRRDRRIEPIGQAEHTQGLADLLVTKRRLSTAATVAGDRRDVLDGPGGGQRLARTARCAITVVRR